MARSKGRGSSSQRGARSGPPPSNPNPLMRQTREAASSAEQSAGAGPSSAGAPAASAKAPRPAAAGGRKGKQVASGGKATYKKRLCDLFATEWADKSAPDMFQEFSSHLQRLVEPAVQLTTHYDLDDLRNFTCHLEMNEMLAEGAWDDPLALAAELMHAAGVEVSACALCFAPARMSHRMLSLRSISRLNPPSLCPRRCQKIWCPTCVHAMMSHVAQCVLKNQLRKKRHRLH